MSEWWCKLDDEKSNRFVISFRKYKSPLFLSYRRYIGVNFNNGTLSEILKEYSVKKKKRKSRVSFILVLYGMEMV